MLYVTLMVKKETVEKGPVRRPQPKHLWLIISGIIGLLLLGTGGWAVWFYSNRVLPNVTVGDIAVGGLTAEDITQKLSQLPPMQATFVNGAQSTTVPFSTLGVTVNVQATVQAALQARRANPWQMLELWQPQRLPLVLSNDWGMLKAYVQQQYPSLFVDAKNATLNYDATAKTFTIAPGTPGKGFDLKKFEQSLPNLALHPGNAQLMVATTTVQPLVQADGLTSTQTAINQRLGLALRFMLNGTIVGQASAADIASWAFFTPDVTKGTASLDFDKAKIQQFIQTTIASKVAVAPVDRKIVIDQQSGSQNVLSEGRAGQEIKDSDVLASAVYDALMHNQPLDQPVTVVNAPLKTVTLTGYGKWIEVDLSKETATMYIGDVPVQSFLISSGKAGTPTELGTFHIYYKTPSQTMTGTIAGEYFYLPNVPWVSFFDGGEAFHGTYWHHNFGHPMSHGCISMTISDAKILYDFAPVGTKVVVHA
jgi:lipoprotein-anchoring transpeptidase ErfK/SrfK